MDGNTCRERRAAQADFRGPFEAPIQTVQKIFRMLSGSFGFTVVGTACTAPAKTTSSSTPAGAVIWARASFVRRASVSLSTGERPESFPASRSTSALRDEGTRE